MLCVLYTVLAALVELHLESLGLIEPGAQPLAESASCCCEEEGKTDPSALRGLLYTLSRLMTVVPKTTTL